MSWPSPPPTGLLDGGKPNALSEGLIAWDGTWYRDIAAHGYHSLPDEALRFFPLFPMLGKAFSIVTAGRVDVALVLIANLASLALAVAVRRLVRFERGNVALADRAVWMVCLFPGAFVLAWGYAEALWLLAAVGVVLGHPQPALVVGGGRGRGGRGQPPLGLVLAVPAAIELARVWRSARNDEKAAGIAAVVSPLVGTGAYLLWVGSSYGNFRLPFSTQGPLRGDTINPISRLWEGLHQMVGPERFSDGLHVPFAIAFVVLLVLTFRWWPASYGVFAAPCWWPPSVPRTSTRSSATGSTPSRWRSPSPWWRRTPASTRCSPPSSGAGWWH